MSQVRVSGNASGTGVLTVTSPNTNSNYTLTLPAETGTILTTVSGVAVNGPAFSAYSSANTSISSSTLTKIPFATEVFDTNSNFDTSNYRFTPTVAGYYQLNASVYVYSSSPSVRYCRLFKNGSAYQQGSLFVSTPPSETTVVYSGLVYMNGTTDYVEMYVYDNGSSPTIYGSSGSVFVWFSGSMVRAA